MYFCQIFLFVYVSNFNAFSIDEFFALFYKLCLPLRFLSIFDVIPNFNFLSENSTKISFVFSGVWQLCSDSYDWWWALHFGSLRYCGSRRLWSLEATFVSTNRCLPGLLLCSFAVILRKCQRKGKNGNRVVKPLNSKIKFKKVFIFIKFLILFIFNILQ